MRKKTPAPKTVTHADGRTYPRHEPASINATAEALTAHGYGVGVGRIAHILSKLTPEEQYDLMYVCHRAAEKLGKDAFLWAKN